MNELTLIKVSAEHECRYPNFNFLHVFLYCEPICLLVLFLIYFPMAAVGYFCLGDKAESNIILSLCPGAVKVTAEVLLLLHLVTAVPILVNAPNQYYEEMIGIPKSESLYCITISRSHLWSEFLEEIIANCTGCFSNYYSRIFR